MEIKHGLNPTPPDSRDYPLGAITDLPALSEIPATFSVGTPTIKDQKDSDFCSAFMSCGMSELQEGVELCPEWAFAVSKEISGDASAFGQDLRTALKVHTKYGAIEAKDAPYSLKNKDEGFLRYIKNWPVLTSKATPHIKQSYLKVTGQYDHFDNIRATLWKYRAEHRGVGTGVLFGWMLSDKFLRTIPSTGTGHAMYFCGQNTVDGVVYLSLVNSAGTKAGDAGKHYMSREVVNHFVELYGAYMFIDMSPEQVKYMLEHGITDKDNWLVQLMKVAVTLLQELIGLKKKS